jgi:alkanesulfonate monooxygenase SsuD/methylene tetrahydromethanopterin reductase-like flavin-dependent oxidoreductase (luciferase family)
MGLDEGNDRFEEALEVLLRSWSADRPFAFDGKYHRYDAAFPQPRPLQQPHPPIWHATTSSAGLRRCAENGWGVLLAQGTPPSAVRTTLDLFRSHHDDLSLVARPESVVLARGMYCARSDEAAFGAFLRPYADFLELAARVSSPPVDAVGTPHRNPFHLDESSDLEASLVCGDPDRCAHSVEQLTEMGIEYVILFVNLGGIDHDRVVASLRLFAAEVMPRFAS